MVRHTLILARNAVIKFRKGGLAQPATSSGPGASAPAAAAAASASQGGCPIRQVQPKTSMSTCAIPDIELPLRYRRAALSQEEIDKINGGGIV